MRVDAVLASAAQRLVQQLDNDQAATVQLDAQCLLCHVLKRSRAYCFAYPEAQLTPDQCAQFEALLARRLTGEPLAYITGEKEFWSMSLKVNVTTLIPRPETELLVEKALEAAAPDSPSRVLDLGTGSGAIALALAKMRPKWQLEAVDQCAAALEVASENARRHGLTQVRFFVSDWLSACVGCYDLIVSNPPYLASGDPHLAGEIRFEPRSALVAGDHGMAAYRAIIAAAPAHLRQGGILLFEHGAAQASAISAELSACGYQHIKTFLDLAGLPRVTLAKWVCSDS